MWKGFLSVQVEWIVNEQLVVEDDHEITFDHRGQWLGIFLFIRDHWLLHIKSSITEKSHHHSLASLCPCLALAAVETDTISRPLSYLLSPINTQCTCTLFHLKPQTIQIPPVFFASFYFKCFWFRDKMMTCVVSVMMSQKFIYLHLNKIDLGSWICRKFVPGVCVVVRNFVKRVFVIWMLC